jgi:type II secretory pathway pseudopilin PulG
MPRWKDRRRAQAGTTLVELLVSLMIVGLALVMIVGTFSSGLLNASVAKRNTATVAVVQYEVDSISASQFNALAPSYSECFATENPAAPTRLPGYQQPCASGAFALRADVTRTSVSPNVQLWSVAVRTWPSGVQVGTSVSFYKVNR